MLRKLAYSATVAVIAISGLSLATASPAGAATSSSWKAYGNTNPITSSDSRWRCGSTRTVVPNVLAQVCAVRSANGHDVRTAVIVRNNQSRPYSAETTARLVSFPDG